jgi:DNA-binding LacI/PurR family transcriptional regulator
MVILAGAHELGLSVPEDLAVIGVDDIPTAAFAISPLTTVAFDFSLATRALAEAVAQALAGSEFPPDEPGPSSRPHVIERASV